MKVEINSHEVVALGKKLDRFKRGMRRRQSQVMVQGSDHLLRTVRQKASGRPGPEVVTGAYRDAFYVRRFNGLFREGYHLRNPSPQARRLERGFYGYDSLGRLYHQPPFPHMGPALQENAEWVAKELSQALDQEWRRS